MTNNDYLELDFRDISDAVAMQPNVSRDLVVRHEARRQDEAQLVLLEQIADAISNSRLGPGIADLVEAERRHVVMRGLLGVADVELDVIPVDLCQRVGLRLGGGAHVRGLEGAAAGSCAAAL